MRCHGGNPPLYDLFRGGDDQEEHELALREKFRFLDTV